MKRPKILITNDDGIHAPGIHHLHKSLIDYADLYIVAPETEQSGRSLSVSVFSSLHVKKVENWLKTPAWSVSGTPADCVKIALSLLLREKPDFIVSGINSGTNAGRTLLYSGTVGGVIEGILRGIPGIAFSSYEFEETEYQAFERYIPTFVDYALKHPLPQGTFLNVNFPSKKMVPQGIKLTRQGRQYWLEDPLDENHESVYLLDARLKAFEEHEDSDIYWLDRGYIAAVPVHVDELTDKAYLAHAKAHFEAFSCEKHPSF